MSQYEEVLKVLNEFDSNQSIPIRGESDISQLIILALNGNKIENWQVQAEFYAFNLMEDSNYGKEYWGTFYGSQTLPGADNEMVEVIPIEKITKEIIDYWESRISQCSNPILKARYAGLVWEFSKKIRSTKPDFNKVGLEHIRGLLGASQPGRFLHSSPVFARLSRALSLASGFNNQELKGQAINAIHHYTLKVGKINKPGLFRRGYDMLVKSNILKFDDPITLEIVADLEDKLNKTTMPNEQGKLDIDSAKVAADRLLEYYDNQNKEQEVSRILNLITTAYEVMIAVLSPSLAIRKLEHLQAYHDKFGKKSDAAVIYKRIQILSPKIMEEMGVFPIEFEISRDKLDEFIENVLAGELNDVYTNLALDFIPPDEPIFPVLEKSKTLSLLTRSLHDKEGRKVAEVGPLAADISGNRILAKSENMTTSAAILSYTMKAAKERNLLSEDSLMYFLQASTIISKKRAQQIRTGIKAYLQDDFITSIHILVPQIEAACLQLMDIKGGSKWKAARNGANNLRIFDDLLRDPIIIEVFGESGAEYFRALFTDQRAWNLRNKVCHGLMDDNEFDNIKADRVFVALLFLGTIKSSANVD